MNSVSDLPAVHVPEAVCLVCAVPSIGASETLSTRDQASDLELETNDAADIESSGPCPSVHAEEAVCAVPSIGASETLSVDSERLLNKHVSIHDPVTLKSNLQNLIERLRRDREDGLARRLDKLNN